MKYWFTILVFIVLMPKLYADNLDEWLGDDVFFQNSLELSAGGDSDSGRSFGAHLSLALPFYAQLDIGYSRWRAPSSFVLQNTDFKLWSGDDSLVETPPFGWDSPEINSLGNDSSGKNSPEMNGSGIGAAVDEVSDSPNSPLGATEIKLQESSWNAWLRSESWHGFSVDLGYETQDKVDTLTSVEAAVQINYDVGRWRFSGAFSRGEVSAFIENDVEYSVSRNGLGVQASYDFSRSHWRVRFDDYRYDKTFSVINNLDRYKESGRKFFIVDRASYLTDWRLSSDVQWYVNPFTLFVGGAQSQSVVETNVFSQLYAGGYYQLTESITLGFVLGTVIDGKLSYGESSIGYYW